MVYLSGGESGKVFHLLFIYMYIYIFQLPLEIQLSRVEGWDPINQFNPATFFACPKPGPGFPTAYVVIFFVFSELS